MSAQPEHPADSRTLAIPHTINDIGSALTGEKRARFYGEVLAAEEKNIASVMRRWWVIAMVDSARGADTSRANVAAGRNLVSLDELTDRINERAAG
ncbi:hypothetical protein [Streptomyces sp. NPDC053720]|uniref:hypothetical protein n=1 Tax=Streptomyces sp. NPDC053720 TaxID=3154855 RepID=UPI00342CD0C4